MKPIVIYLADKKITLTREEFEQYIKDAYDAGRAEGYNEGVASCRKYDWWNTPITVSTTNPTITWEKTSTPYDPYKITCMNGEASNAVGD